MSENNKWADKDHKWLIIEERKHMWHSSQIDRFASVMGLCNGMTVADIGCGLGYLGWTYWRHFGQGGTYIGVDCSDELIAEAEDISSRWSVGGTAEFITGSCYDLPIPDESVDAAMCQTLLMHLEHPDKALEEMVRITRPGGVIVCKELDSTSRYLRLGYHSNCSDISVDDIVFQRRMKLHWIQGREKLGYGDFNIGAKVPRMMHEAGLSGIKGFCNERLEFLVPPYKEPEQKQRVSIVGKTSGTYTEEQLKEAREAYREYYLAGGGDASTFDDDYSRLRQLMAEQRKSTLKQLQEEQLFSCAGGNNFLCIMGRKPGKEI